MLVDMVTNLSTANAMPSTSPATAVELREQVEKAQLTELLVIERTARDMAQWDRMLASYAPDSVVDISWIYSSGEDFIAQSRRLYEAGVRSLHQIGHPIIQIRGNKAISDTGCAIIISGRVDDVAVNVIAYARLQNRFVRPEGKWLIAGLRAIYQTDMLVPMNPSEHVNVDSVKFASFRSSYGAMSYLQSVSGQTPRLDLPGIDQPETVKALISSEEAWLNE